MLRVGIEPTIRAFEQAKTVHDSNRAATVIEHLLHCTQIIERRNLSVFCHEESHLNGVYGGQSGTGAGFLPVLHFPLPILSPPNAPYLSSGGWYNRAVSD
jgi:hypothetical protein